MSNPQFTARHYRTIAEVLERERFNMRGADGPSAIEDLMLTFAELFESDNPRFDRTRFLTACGLESGPSDGVDGAPSGNVGALLVQRYKIIGTELEVFEAWERETGKTGTSFFSHSTITTIDGQWYGRVGTRCLPADVEALAPGSDERIARVRDWHQRQAQQAHESIIAAHPVAAWGERKDDGTIMLNWERLAGFVFGLKEGS